MFKIIEMSKIKSGENIRNEKDDDILELAQSIETYGLINPITVKPVENGFYEVVTGHRRYEAVKRLGLPHIECLITDNTSEKDLMLIQIAENVQRKDMSALELVEVFDEMKKRFNINQKQLAHYFHKSDTWVCNQYQAAKIIEEQYGDDIPADVKKLGAGTVKNLAKRKMTSEKSFMCRGMSVKIKGHVYTIVCVDNETENELQDFIKAHKL
jgi:ParB family chromosome partitioning protein